MRLCYSSVPHVCLRRRRRRRKRRSTLPLFTLFPASLKLSTSARARERERERERERVRERERKKKTGIRLPFNSFRPIVFIYFCFVVDVVIMKPERKITHWYFFNLLRPFHYNKRKLQWNTVHTAGHSSFSNP